MISKGFFLRQTPQGSPWDLLFLLPPPKTSKIHSFLVFQQELNRKQEGSQGHRGSLFYEKMANKRSKFSTLENSKKKQNFGFHMSLTHDDLFGLSFIIKSIKHNPHEVTQQILAPLGQPSQEGVACTAKTVWILINIFFRIAPNHFSFNTIELHLVSQFQNGITLGY